MKKILLVLYVLVLVLITGSCSSNLNEYERDEFDDIPFNTTGEDIHSNYKDEIVSYLMNNSLQWNMVDKKFVKEFIDIVFSSGIFNTKSSFWLKRFPDIKL